MAFKPRHAPPALPSSKFTHVAPWVTVGHGPAIPDGPAASAVPRRPVYALSCPARVSRTPKPWPGKNRLPVRLRCCVHISLSARSLWASAATSFSAVPRWWRVDRTSVLMRPPIWRPHSPAASCRPLAACAAAHFAQRCAARLARPAFPGRLRIELAALGAREPCSDGTRRRSCCTGLEIRGVAFSFRLLGRGRLCLRSDVESSMAGTDASAVGWYTAPGKIHLRLSL